MLGILGKSGSGKTTIEKYLRNRGLTKSISYTTRKPRCGERNGLDYYFLSDTEFKHRIRENFFAEYALYDGYYYGTAISDINSKSVFKAIEPQGFKQLKTKFGDKVIGIYLEVPTYVRIKRLLMRSESIPFIISRLRQDRNLFDDVDDYIDIKINGNQSISKILEDIKRELKYKLDVT